MRPRPAEPTAKVAMQKKGPHSRGKHDQTVLSHGDKDYE
jgi:hypothetical protein